MKTTLQLSEQVLRISRKATEQARMRARLADPATGGSPHLTHNWGNAEARRAWAIADNRSSEAYRVYSHLFNSAEHRARHSDKRHNSSLGGYPNDIRGGEMEHEVMITMSAVEYQKQQKAMQDLADAAEKMLFISPIGMEGTVQYAAWTQLRAELAKSKVFWQPKTGQ